MTRMAKKCGMVKIKTVMAERTEINARMSEITEIFKLIFFLLC